MAISQIPAASVSVDTVPTAKVLVPSSLGEIITSTQNFAVGIYVITCISTTIARVEFLNGETIIGTATTANGTVTFQLATAATSVRCWIDTGTDVIVNIGFTGSTLVESGSTLSGTLDTLTTSGTYNATSNNGLFYVIAIGAGGGGASGNHNSGNGPTGGASGGLASGPIASSLVPISYTVGAGGVGGVLAGSNVSNATAGGATTFSTLTANGGGKGNTAGNGSNDDGAGTPGGAGFAAGRNVSLQPVYRHARGGASTTITKGGASGGSLSNGGSDGDRTAATANGYGSGGGPSNEGNGANARGGSGGGGVIYVLRSFTAS
jgi:hypothetical protein